METPTLDQSRNGNVVIIDPCAMVERDEYSMQWRRETPLEFQLSTCCIRQIPRLKAYEPTYPLFICFNLGTSQGTLTKTRA